MRVILAITRHVSVLTISTKSTPLFPTTSHALLHYCSLCSTPGVFSTTWRTLASFCFLTLQNLLVPNGVANVISPDCSLLNKKHRTKCTKLTELHTKAFQVSCTDVCIAVPAKLYGFWVFIYFSHEFSFQILYILYFWQIQCGKSFVRSGDERKKRKVY